MLAVGDAMFLGLVEALDSVTELSAGPAAGLLGFEDTGAVELGDVLQFVGGEPEEKLAGFALLRVGRDGAQGLHQDCLHRR